MIPYFCIELSCDFVNRMPTMRHSMSSCKRLARNAIVTKRLRSRIYLLLLANECILFKIGFKGVLLQIVLLLVVCTVYL